MNTLQSTLAPESANRREKIIFDIGDLSISSDFEPLPDLPLPELSKSTKNSSCASTLRSESIPKPISVALNLRKITQDPISTKRSSILNNSTSYAKNCQLKPISKLSGGGLNIIQSIKRKAGNSYLARKERYIEKMMNKQIQWDKTPIITESRCISGIDKHYMRK